MNTSTDQVSPCKKCLTNSECCAGIHKRCAKFYNYQTTISTECSSRVPNRKIMFDPHQFAIEKMLQGTA